MSEIGIISCHYSLLVNTTDKMNRAIIVLKKQYLINQGTDNQKLKLSEGDVDSAEADLKDFLEFFIDIQRGKDDPHYKFVPKIIVEKFKNDKIISQSLEELKLIKKRVTKHSPLNKTHFVLLDRLVTILDVERSILFKNLRTARG